MLKKVQMLNAIAILASFSCFGAIKASPPAEQEVIWRIPNDIESRDLFYGVGGQEHQPRGSFRFIEEDMDGTNPKFTIEDEDGVRWKVKLGDEVRSETAASRFLWAVGYFTDEDYFVASLRVGDMPRLKRGQKFVEHDGTIRNARMERHVNGQEKTGKWRWRDYRAGGREINGLRVMMALLNNWDLKDVNNRVFDTLAGGEEYGITDLGATFGRTGNVITRSKGVSKDYAQTKFIADVTATHVDFVMQSRPFLPLVLYPSHYRSRTRMERLVKHVPLADARWIGDRLGRLSAEQIRDAFRASGFSPADIEVYTQVVVTRIRALQDLSPQVSHSF